MTNKWDNILESRGPAGVGKSRSFRPGGGPFSDLGKDCTAITASHMRVFANLTVHNNCLIDIIMLSGRNVSPYPTITPDRIKPALTARYV